MGFFIKSFVIGLILGGGALFLLPHLIGSAKVDVPENGWYGSGSPRKDDVAIHPFKISVPEDVLKDLKDRLARSRVTHEVLEDSDNFYYGFNSKYLLEVKEYWRTKYDWRKAEAELNAFNQFKTQIEGLNIHFIHQKPDAKKYARSVPILIVHGWPGNVYEFHKIIPMLVDPKAHGIDSDVAFEVVAPSIPGYGWSDQPKKTGFSQVSTARVFRKLMQRLGYKKWFLQGGDWGSLVTSNFAKLYPETVHGLHLNMVFIGPDSSLKGLLYSVVGSIMPSVLFKSKEVQNFNLLERMKFAMIELGYMHIQASKPDTVGTGLNDSPLGLMAYILEKYSTWTNMDNKALQDGGLTKKFTLDQLLTMISIYWTNGNIVSSQRYYREFFLDVNNQQLGRVYCSVPTAHASALNEAFDRTPIEISSCGYNITQYTEIADAGHFMAFEMPKPLANDIFKFAHSLGHR